MSRACSRTTWQVLFGLVLLVLLAPAASAATSAEATYDAARHDYDDAANLSQTSTETPSEGRLSGAACGTDFSLGHQRLAADLVAPSGTRFFAGNGPLDEAVAATFRSGTYDEVFSRKTPCSIASTAARLGPSAATGHVRLRLAQCRRRWIRLSTLRGGTWPRTFRRFESRQERLSMRVPQPHSPWPGAVRYLAAETKSSFQELIRLGWWGDNERSSV